MWCVRALGVPDSSRRLPETTHDVYFVCSKFASQEHRKLPTIAKLFLFTRGREHGTTATSTMKK